MQRHELEAVFDRSASTYDQHLSRLAPLLEALQQLVDATLTDLPENSRILCVGAGTGSELIELARRHPRWTFTAVEPSVRMLEVCQQKTKDAGVFSRCIFHAGYLDSLPATEGFDAATAILVSQFLPDREARIEFFRSIGARLRPGGWLVSADLAADTASPAYELLLTTWWRLMRATDSPDGLNQLRNAYARDVAIVPPAALAEIIASAGFAAPVPFFQSGLLHAWFAQRLAEDNERQS
jgi:tRNA (cmo5U34)-methyltransferase